MKTCTNSSKDNLEGIYQAKSILSQLLMKEMFHILRMDENTKVND